MWVDNEIGIRGKAAQPLESRLEELLRFMTAGFTSTDEVWVTLK